MTSSDTKSSATDAMRALGQVLKAQHVINDGDMHLLRALPAKELTSLGPFVFIDHYQHRGLRGIGDAPHPHAGIEVISYLLEGSVEHRDSMGNTDRLGPGDAQFIRSGRGMVHAEQPLSGRHGLQLWASLPPDMKLVEPLYGSYRAADIPLIAGEGTSLHVIAGTFNGVTGPMPLSGGAVFASLQMRGQSRIALHVDPEIELGIYVLRGQLNLGGRHIVPGELGILSQGNTLHVEACGDETIEVALLGGMPVQGDVLFSGPFVMDTQERLAQAKRDYSEGRMGRIEGIANR